MDITITLNNEDEVSMITSTAAENELTVPEYITNIARGWIQERVRAIYIGHVSGLSLPELKALLGPYQDL